MIVLTVTGSFRRQSLWGLIVLEVVHVYERVLVEFIAGYPRLVFVI